MSLEGVLRVGWLFALAEVLTGMLLVRVGSIGFSPLTDPVVSVDWMSLGEGMFLFGLGVATWLVSRDVERAEGIA